MMVVVVVIMIMVMVMVMVIAVIVIMPLAFLVPFLVPLLTTRFVPLLLANHVLLMPQLFAPQRLLAFVFPLTDVTRLIFPGLHEIHLPVAGVILVTMQAPGPGVLRRNMQVKRLRYDDVWWRLLDDDRLCIDQRWRRPAADVHSAIDARRNFTVNRHPNIHIRVGSSGSESQGHHRCYAIGTLHNQSFSPQETWRKVAERLPKLE
jgi:hypothetical protein